MCAAFVRGSLKAPVEQAGVEQVGLRVPDKIGGVKPEREGREKRLGSNGASTRTPSSQQPSTNVRWRTPCARGDEARTWR
jgi:hypothetical protein